MKKKVVVATIFIVLFIIGVFLINDINHSDEETLTIPYKEGADVFVPPNAGIVEKFDAGGMAIATIGMDGFKQLSSTGGNNFMSTSVINKTGGLWSAVPVVKVDYYSVILTSGGMQYVMTASDKISFPKSRALKWGKFYPDGNYSLDIAYGKSAIYFPMKYGHSYLKIGFFWFFYLFLDALACACATLLVLITIKRDTLQAGVRYLQTAYVRLRIHFAD